MWDQDLKFCDWTSQHGRRHHRCAVTFACLLLMGGPGCGLDGTAPVSERSVELIMGKDSAGAIIELEKRAGNLTRARVIDLVLGTGEAEIISSSDGHVEFTMHFPSGTAISHI